LQLPAAREPDSDANGAAPDALASPFSPTAEGTIGMALNHQIDDLGAVPAIVLE
jgi:hypothetical protein